jgi:hypothetical protein
MKSVALEETNLTAEELVALARKQPVILTRGGKPVVAVKDLTGSDWESVALANSPRFIALIEESRRSYRREGGIPLAEVRKQLGLKPAARTRAIRAKKRA